MASNQTSNDQRAAWTVSMAAGIMGGLCCLASIVLVLFGLAGVAAAASIGNVLYGNYRWYFRLFAAVCAITGLVLYFRSRGICTLDEARRQRTRLINAALLVSLAGAGVYIFWTYVVLHYWGIAVGLPWAQYDESWAIPASAVMLGLAAVATILIRRSKARSADVSRVSGPAAR